MEKCSILAINNILQLKVFNPYIFFRIVRSPSQELVEAAEKGDVEACKDLIAKGAEVDYDDGDPIVRAIKEGNTKEQLQNETSLSCCS